MPNREEFFTRFLIIAAFFLFLINGIKWFPMGIDLAGIEKGANSFCQYRFLLSFYSIYLKNRTFGRNICLDDPHENAIVNYTDFFQNSLACAQIFRKDWGGFLLLRNSEGMKVSSFVERAGAIIPALNPIISVMFEEISRNALVITSRGFLAQGNNSSRIELVLSKKDLLSTAIVTAVFSALLILN